MCCSCQLHELQRQRESCSLEVKDTEEERATLSQRKQTLKDGAFMERVMNPESSNVSFNCWLSYTCFNMSGFFLMPFCCSTVSQTALCRHVGAGEGGDGQTAGQCQNRAVC